MLLPKRAVEHVVVSFSFRRQDAAIALLIQAVLGEGHFKRHSNKCVLQFGGYSSLLAFAKLVNGHIRGPKYERFAALVGLLNRIAGSTVVELLPADTSPVGSTAWLVGLLDADGHFGVSARLSNDGSKRYIYAFIELRQSFYLSSTGASNLPLMEPIALFMGCKLGQTGSNWSTNVGSTEGVAALRSYIERYGLLSVKRNDYDAWCLVHDAQVQETVYLRQDELIAIKLSNNKARTAFSHAHLEPWITYHGLDVPPYDD